MHRSIPINAGVCWFALMLFAGQPVSRDLQHAGEQAYLFAYPMVLLDAFSGLITTQVGWNNFAHMREFPSNSRLGAGPNADTLYSFAWLDLSKEPVLLHVPDTHGRYYVMQLLDGWTETVALVGKRTTGTGERWFAIVGPGWRGKLPAAVTRIDSPSNRVFLHGRIQTNTAADYANVRALQAQCWLVALSIYPNRPEVPPPFAPSGLAAPPLYQTVARMSTDQFFTRFATLLADNPPHAGDDAMMKQLADLGIEPGKPLAAKVVEPAFERGVKDAKEILAGSPKRAKLLGKIGKTFWTVWTSGHYGTNYGTRAVIARLGLTANPPEEALYLATGRDGTGAPLDGARKYVMHFEKGQLPPVRAFWSVSLYEGGNPTPNPLNRYALGDRDPLKYNPDGSLDLCIQSESPGAGRESNWLPAPAAGFALVLRLYWPKEPALRGEWTPPAVITSTAP